MSTKTKTNSNPYSDFKPEEMKTFYDNQKYLTYVDARPLLKACISDEYELREYSGTCHSIGTVLVPRVFGGVYETTRYERDYISSYITEVNTQLLIDKLDASLYYWRNLNPQLYELLSRYSYQKIEIISNWLAMIHYLCPPELNGPKTFELIS